MLRQFRFALFCLIAALGAASHAQDAQAPQMTAETFEASLNYQKGKISLPGGIATLNLPEGFRYLSPADSERLLAEGWGNPPGNTTLGMIVPANVGVLSEAGWGVVVTYENDGHVKDGDADTIDYADLLKEMQAGVKESNAERVKAGFKEMSLLGWAEKPSYDKANHKLYWAKEFQNAGVPENTLNYNIRVLGREGVLVLNAVASMKQLPIIRQEMKLVTGFSDFTPGNRYADFNSTTDKTAEYGLAALVAGGAAAKLGLFGKLFALLLAFKKFVIMGLGALVYGLFKLFGARRAARVNLDK